MDHNQLSEFLFLKRELIVKNWFKIQVQGTDAFKFLQTQTTADISKIVPGLGIWSCRLSSKGKIAAYFVIFARDKGYELVFPEENSPSIKSLLEKNIISEDVWLSDIENCSSKCYWGPLPSHILENPEIKKDFFTYAGSTLAMFDVDPGEELEYSHPQFSLEEEKILKVLGSYPTSAELGENGKLFNETILDPQAISYSKGCFLGQETVARVHNIKGPARAPVYILEHRHHAVMPEKHESIFDQAGQVAGEFIAGLSHSDFTIWAISASRAFRVQGMPLNLKTANGLEMAGKISFFPIYGGDSFELISGWLFQKVTEKYAHGGDLHEAIAHLCWACAIYPGNLEALESLGVLYGKAKMYPTAIEIMKKLAKKNPDSVLALTNLSLFYMKLGEIKLAEQYKDEAVVKEFQSHSKKIKESKQIAIKEDENKTRLNKKKLLYEQVLEIDPDDVMANFGLAEYFFEMGDDEKSLGHLDKLMSGPKKNAGASFLTGKIHAKHERFEIARTHFNESKIHAAKNGDSRLAREAQAFIDQIMNK